MRVIKAVFLSIAIGVMCLGTEMVCKAQTAPADLSPDVQEVLTLSKQHMDDSVITNYIASTGKVYRLSADDIIYLNSQGVSQAVISALLETSNNGNVNSQPAPAAQPTPDPPTPTPTPPNQSSSATPPPLDANPAPSPAPPQSASMPPPGAPPQMSTTSGFLDNFYQDGGLNPALWQTESPLLSSLAVANGKFKWVLPTLTFSPSGMQMSGIRHHKEFMGIQSATAYSAPFSFSTTVFGMVQDTIPFGVYLVSSDLQQWVSVTGHLGGRGGPPGVVHVGMFGPFGGASFGIPTGGPSKDYGIWVNHTGSGYPISEMGNKIYPYPIAGAPYTIQISVGGDGLAFVTLLDGNHVVIGGQSVPVGTGPFYIVLSGRDGKNYSVWQSAQVTPQGPPPPATTASPTPDVPQTPNLDYFQQQLTPYGSWVNVPGYGQCWQPAVELGWRPYYDGGHWEYTDAGYYWQSDYPWGDIAFHYGRWTYVNFGAAPCWIWVPGYEYAPSWVVWRHDDDNGYIGWAPLPPNAFFVNGDWYYYGARVRAGFDFGFGPDYFTFVGYDHFWEHNYRLYVVPHDRVYLAYHHSVIINHYGYQHGAYVNMGIPHDRMVVYTHQDVHPMPMADLQHQQEMHAAQRNNDIHNYHSGAQPNAWGHSQGQGNGQNGHQGH